MASKLKHICHSIYRDNTLSGNQFYEAVKDRILSGLERFNGWTSVYRHPVISPEDLHRLREFAYVSYHLRPRYVWQFLKSTILHPLFSRTPPVNGCSAIIKMNRILHIEESLALISQRVSTARRIGHVCCVALRRFLELLLSTLCGVLGRADLKNVVRCGLEKRRPIALYPCLLRQKCRLGEMCAGLESENG